MVLRWEAKSRKGDSRLQRCRYITTLTLLHCSYRRKLITSLVSIVFPFHHVVDVQWKPYFLSVNTPVEGEDLMEHLAAKYGRAAVEKFSQPGNPLDQAGDRVGIRFNRTRRFVNTLNGHRLMEWCNKKHPDRSDALMEKIFHAYFEQGRDVSKTEVLTELASETGLGSSADELKTMLSSEDYKDEVLQYDRQVKQHLRVSGVPYFIVHNNNEARPTAFSGAQVKYSVHNLYRYTSK